MSKISHCSPLQTFSHPEELVLTPDQEELVERWVEKRDSFGYPPKHKELVRMVESMLNSDAEGKPEVGGPLHSTISEGTPRVYDHCGLHHRLQ